MEREEDGRKVPPEFGWDECEEARKQRLRGSSCGVRVADV